MIFVMIISSSCLTAGPHIYAIGAGADMHEHT